MNKGQHHLKPRSEGFPCWVDLSVHDVDGAVMFYRNVLGWEFADSSAEYGGYRMASLGGVQTAGIGPQQGDNPSYWVLYFATDDVDALAIRAKQLGGTVYVEPFDVGTQGRMAIITDPTGAFFGAWQSVEHSGFGASEQPGFFTWAEVNTPDASKARDFERGYLLSARYRSEPGVVRVSPVSSRVFMPERIIGQPP